MSEVDGNKKEIINMLKVQVKDSVSIDKAIKIIENNFSVLGLIIV